VNSITNHTLNCFRYLHPQAQSWRHKVLYPSFLDLFNDTVSRPDYRLIGGMVQWKLIINWELQYVLNKIKPSTVKHLFYFYFFEVHCHKQRKIAADDENAPVSSKNNVPYFAFGTLCVKHQSLTNAEDFHAVQVGLQHSIFYSFDFRCSHSSGTMFRPWKTNCPTRDIINNTSIIFFISFSYSVFLSLSLNFLGTCVVLLYVSPLRLIILTHSIRTLL